MYRLTGHGHSCSDQGQYDEIIVFEVLEIRVSPSNES